MDEKEIEVTVRAIIVSEGKLLVFKLHHSSSVWSLPGGKVEFGESLEEAITRELTEETNIAPVLGKIVAVNQMLLADKHRVEFFFRIINSRDCLDLDPTKSSHGFEIAAWQFVDPQDAAVDIRPKFLREFISNQNLDKLAELKINISRES